jgi:hypothetical protein
MIALHDLFAASLLGVALAACQCCQRPLPATESSTSGQPGSTAPASPGAPPASPEAPSVRLEPGHLRYAGAFRLPAAFNWGARGIAYYPKGGGGAGSLLVTGFEMPRNRKGEECANRSDCHAFFGEVQIPAPVVSSSFDNVPEAALLRPMTAVGGALFGGLDPSVTWVSDIEYVPRRGSQTGDKLYGSLTLWYAEGAAGDETFPTVWYSSLDGTGTRGPFHVGPRQSPFHGRKFGDYLFRVPQGYADRYLGGRTLVTGRARGTPAGQPTEGNVAGGSQGPTLFAFRPFDADSAAGDLDALPILYYRVFFPSCAGPNVGDPNRCDFRGYTMCDIWTGGAFVESGSRQAIVLLGYKGLGKSCYDDPPIDCRDPCSQYHGYHCNPYERQVLFYDVTQLAQAAQGRLEPWTVLPYAVWKPQELFLRGQTCGDVGGMTFDPASRRLFVVERGLGGPSDNATAVHVWVVAG